MAQQKRVTVYSKNGNEISVLLSVVDSFLKNGFTKNKPKIKKESEKK